MEDLIFISSLELIDEDERTYNVQYELITDESIEKLNSISKSSDLEFLEEFVREEVFTLKELINPNRYVDRYFIINNENGINDLPSLQSGGNESNAKKIQMMLIQMNKKYKKHKNEIVSKETSLREKDRWKLISLYVGRGDSTLIITPTKKAYLFDCGDKKQKVYKKVLDYLDSYKIKELSGIFISHPDNDHFGGVGDVLENVNLSHDCFIYFNDKYNTGGVYWTARRKLIDQYLNNGSLRFLKMPKNSKSKLTNFLDGLPATFYWPYQSHSFSKSNNKSISKNDSSHGIFIGNTGKYLVNICGDIEDEGWSELIMKHKVDTKINKDYYIFKYSHHGRRSGNPQINKKYVNAYFTANNIRPEHNIVSTSASKSNIKHLSPEIIIKKSCSYCKRSKVTCGYHHPKCCDVIYEFSGEQIQRISNRVSIGTFHRIF